MTENKVANITELLEINVQKTENYIVVINDLKAAKEQFRLLMIKLRRFDFLNQMQVRDILIEKNVKKKDWHKQNLSNMERGVAPISIEFIRSYINALGYNIKFLIDEN